MFDSSFYVSSQEQQVPVAELHFSDCGVIIGMALGGNDEAERGLCSGFQCVGEFFGINLLIIVRLIGFYIIYI